METKILLQILVLLGIIFSSCVTIFNGAHQIVKFESTPPGASVIINGVDVNKITPCNISVKRKVPETEKNIKNEQHYVLKKEGYFDYEYKDYRKIPGLFLFLDFYPGMIIPGLIDLAVGSHLTYKDLISANLNAKEIIREKEIVYINTGSGKPNYEFKHNSDVDKNIPETNNTNQYRFALIIGNEDYSSQQMDLSSEVNVEFARNDASAFKDYCTKTLGVPEKNVIFLTDATSGKMNQGISKINLLIKNAQGEAEVLFYYAGHGMPDEITKEPYIIPVDVSGKNLSSAIKLKDIYIKLTEFPSKRITVFLDACFSGGGRNQGLVAARGIKIKPKESDLSGKLIVFSASSEDQSSLAYKDKEHGLFSYFLLKKLQATKGDISYKQLSEYLEKEVGLNSVLLNDKEQNAKTSVSPAAQNDWTKWNLK